MVNPENQNNYPKYEQHVSSFLLVAELFVLRKNPSKYFFIDETLWHEPVYAAKNENTLIINNFLASLDNFLAGLHQLTRRPPSSPPPPAVRHPDTNSGGGGDDSSWLTHTYGTLFYTESTSDQPSQCSSVFFFRRETFTTHPWTIRKKTPVKRKVTREQFRPKKWAWKQAWTISPILTREKKRWAWTFSKRHPWTPIKTRKVSRAAFFAKLIKKRPAEVLKFCRKNQFNRLKIVFKFYQYHHNPFSRSVIKKFPKTAVQEGLFYIWKFLSSRGPKPFSVVSFYFELDFIP